MIYIAEMLASSATTADTTLLAHNLRNQPHNITSASQEMTVAAVVAYHVVATLERPGYSDTYPLLTDTSVNCTV
jgi:hypothetical protein